jgi:2-amino-4-hydroxy-6-hydroxymethyldihydropteridine diphosphokinase
VRFFGLQATRLPLQKNSMRTGIALGSNLGDRQAHFRAARTAIVDLTDVAPPILSSAIYETEPVDCEPGAASFLNAVLEFDYDGDAADLLKKLKQIENDLGRPADHPRNTSRRIDIDLLYFGDARIDQEKLKVPHPRMHLRRFVLQPLADIRPDLILPGQTKTVGELLALLSDSSKVVRLTTEWETP